MEFNKWFEDNYARLTRDCNIEEIAEEAWDAGQLEERKSNANLITSAPELLEQLIRLRNKIASYKPDDDDDLDIVDAVIAKALGQQ
ncbi:hypothetical protein Pm5461_124 [Proteus phage vB_PmiM_Pm5461]|uniref:Uncharacterized protein n=1 Tax=Proteus phage vB_PmiM_Pm5461 TaxID=1636250 RepID=A0A0G2SS78_9CAUD|nr:hypothetical protein AVT59_gp248 [Proteus phage vB_PmiM_Pm5461]AKA61989.1 hypothetical protein Pm5461_124 [Proteus phage vB_PmiM_Pm5461]